MSALQDVARLIVMPVSIVTAGAWVLRSAINHVLARDVGRFKDQLAAAAKERETRFTILQTRRAEVIETLYGKLFVFMAATENFVAPIGYSSDPTKEEQLKTVAEAQRDFRAYYMRNRIYFSETICEGIDNLFKTIVPKLTTFGFTLALADKHPEHGKDKLDAWNEAWNSMQERVPPIMQAIEADFRELLGVEAAGRATP